MALDEDEAASLDEDGATHHLTGDGLVVDQRYLIGSTAVLSADTSQTYL